LLTEKWLVIIRAFLAEPSSLQRGCVHRMALTNSGQEKTRFNDLAGSRRVPSTFVGTSMNGKNPRFKHPRRSGGGSDEPI